MVLYMRAKKSRKTIKVIRIRQLQPREKVKVKKRRNKNEKSAQNKN